MAPAVDIAPVIGIVSTHWYATNVLLGSAFVKTGVTTKATTNDDSVRGTESGTKTSLALAAIATQP
jgi:hypothetical protein